MSPPRPALRPTRPPRPSRGDRPAPYDRWSALVSIATAMAVLIAVVATDGATIGGVRLVWPVYLVAFVGLRIVAHRVLAGRTALDTALVRVELIVATAIVFVMTTRHPAFDAPTALARAANGILAAILVVNVGARSWGRYRLTLLLSLAALAVAGGGRIGTSEHLGLVILWVLAAGASLFAHEQAGFVASPGLEGSTRPPAARARLRAALVEYGALLAVFLVIATLVTAAHPRPPSAARGSTSGGEAQKGALAAPYLGFSDTLDTSLRGQPGNATVMRVEAAAPDLWRGQTFDQWDGRVWHRSTAMAPPDGYRSPGGGYVLAGIGDVSFGGQRFVQHYHVLAPFEDVLFGAYQVAAVDAPGGVDVDLDGTVHARQPLGPGAEYTVASYRPPVTADRLRANDPGQTDIPGVVRRLYLGLPAVPDRVTALARRVTADAPTTYDKVLALEGWMAANTRYTRDIPPLPAGADAVDQFLFVDKRGFCEQIGTSLAVMLRSIGVPARLAVGFAPGTESLLGGTFTVHAGDAHAWVEVWFPQIGWQAFDPTAHVPLAGESHSTLGTRLGHLLRQLLPWLLAVAGVLAAVGLWFAGRALARRRRVRHERPWVVGYYRRLGALGAKRGRPPSPSETPLEYGAALGDVLDDDRFAEIAEILNRAAYDRAPPAPSQQAWAEEVLATHR